MFSSTEEEMQNYSNELAKWNEPDTHLSNLIRDFTEEKINEFEILQFIKSEEGKNQLYSKLRNRLFYYLKYLKFLRTTRPSHRTYAGRDDEDGYSCSAPKNYIEHQQLERDLKETYMYLASNISKYIILDKSEKLLISSIVCHDICLTFLIKIFSTDTVIQCLEQFTDYELRVIDYPEDTNIQSYLIEMECSITDLEELKQIDLMISAVCNQRYSNNIMSYLLTRGYSFREIHLTIAIKIGNENAVNLLLENGLLPNERLLNEAVQFNYVRIVEHLIEYANILEIKNQLISLETIKYAFENNSLELLQIIFRYTDLVKLNIEIDTFTSLILNDLCSNNKDINYYNTTLVLFLIKKGLVCDFSIDLKTVNNYYIGFHRPNAYNHIKIMYLKIKEILLFYSSFTEKSMIRDEFIEDISSERFEEIVKNRNLQMQIAAKELYWSHRKSIALFIHSFVKIAPKFYKSNNKKIKSSTIVLYGRRFVRHFASFLGPNLENPYNAILPDGHRFLNTIDYLK